MDPSPTSEIDVLQVLAKLHDSCEAAGRQNPGSQHRCQGDPPHRRLAFLLRVRQAVRANCALPRGSPLAIRPQPHPYRISAANERVAVLRWGPRFDEFNSSSDNPGLFQLMRQKSIHSKLAQPPRQNIH